MSTLSGLISAGGGSTSFPVIFLSKSQTFVPPQDGNVCIHVIGAGGSGSGSRLETEAGGGGAGGYCRKNSLAVTTSSSFTVVIGAGHVPTSGHSAGGNGGNSTVAGTGLSATLTANGGTGHPKNNTAGSGAGGTAANGDVNNTGGAGQAKYGGGAVGITGTGNQGFVHINSSEGTYLGFGGACDVLGDLWSSSLGQIAGGLPGRGVHSNTTTFDTASSTAGPLSGGGTVKATGHYTYHAGGAATIGGGGGGCMHNQGNPGYGAIGGRGGDGLVIFQYIP